MSHRLLLFAALVLMALPATLRAEPPAALNLKKGDVTFVELELRPGATPALAIHFTNHKLLEAQTIIAAHLDEPIAITMDGQLVVTPRIKDPKAGKSRYLTLRFPDFAAAARAARQLVPTP